MGATTIESIVSSDTIWPVVCNIFTTIMEQGFVIVDIVRHIVKQHLRNRQLHPFLPFLVIMGKEEEAKSLGSTIYWRDNRKLTSHTLLSHLYCHIFFAINFFSFFPCFFLHEKAIIPECYRRSKKIWKLSWMTRCLKFDVPKVAPFSLSLVIINNNLSEDYCR